MAIKWQRNYVLNVELIDGTVETIQYPLTLEFYIKRTGFQGINTCQFRVYNLNDTSRQGIRKDWNDATYYRSLKLQAGYGAPPYPLIFNGNIQQAGSWRDSGSPNYITEITGYDYGFNTTTAFINQTIAPNGSQGTSKQVVIQTLVNNLVNTPAILGGSGSTGLAVGYITQAYQGIYYPRGRVLMGNTWQILQQETDGTAFIDNGRINILQNTDVFTGGIPILNASTGLLSTPKKNELYLEIEILFEPNIACGQLIQLDSVSSPEWNANYKVYSLEHRGIISGAVNGKCTTKLLLLTVPAYSQISNEGF